MVIEHNGKVVTVLDTKWKLPRFIQG
ncbi:hypothetical protein [Photobacterium leiognathi]